MRLDLFLTKSGMVQSRNKAQELIKGKKVKVDGKVVVRPSFEVEDHRIEIDTDELYVGRAALKLKSFLDDVPIDIRGKVCLDIGASTGGFSEVLLELGAKKVVAVDVGKMQLHPKLRENPNIESHEETDIRHFKSNERFDIVTCDISFISIHNILDAIDKLADDIIIILFKPQFEVGKEVKRDSRGVVRDQKAIMEAQVRFKAACLERGWRPLERRLSKVKGKEGNVEWFYLFGKKR